MCRESRSILINIKEMKKYYEKFDPVSFKYMKLLEDKLWRKFVKKQKSLKEWYLAFHSYEEAQQFEELARKEFGNLQANLDMAYADEELTNDFFEIYDLVSDKIVRRYINIDGVERLFSEKYASFEWEMHLGVDHKKHSMQYYRDHFIHQIKDAYTMAILLEKGGFYGKVRNILMDTGSSKISRYVNKMLEQQRYQPRKTVFTGEYGDEITDEDLKEHYIHNIIYMAGYMAGLFHDIGYPTVSNMQEHRRMIEYLAETHYFEKGVYDFNNIMALLQNSLLFRVVSPSEIRGRIEGDKIDHGTLSALLFLLHFYENGAIFRLEPYKLCAVELAGLAIYNHTNTYVCLGGKGAIYERCVFALNPMSYLLRICDDLQEWGRIYFEVSEQSNLIKCNQCHMPIKRVKDGMNVYYQCNCTKDEKDENKKNEEGRKSSLFVPIFGYHQFPYRRIFNISVCSAMEISWNEDFLNYTFRLTYDLDRLLHIAYINPGYARYRIKELAQMKRIFPRQHGLGMVFVDYFVTANIILIKSAIIGKYLQKIDPDNYGRMLEKVEMSVQKIMERVIGEDQAFKKIKGAVEEGNMGLLKEISYNRNELRRTKNRYMQFGNKMRKLYKQTGDKEYKCLEKDLKKKQEDLSLRESRLSKLKEYLSEAFNTYIFIYCMMYVGRRANTERPYACGEIQVIVRKMLELLYKKGLNKPKFCTEDVEILIDDCCVQIEAMYENLSAYRYYPEKYFETFQTMKEKEELYYNALERFANMENYRGIYEDKEMKLNAYTDLHWFQEMLLEIGK